MYSRRCLPGFVFALVVASGCGPPVPTGEIVKTVPASGMLTYKGKPLADYMVVFYPENARPAAGKTDEHGRFQLGTNGPGDGAVAGVHRVAVNYGGPESSEPGGKDEMKALPPPPVAIPEKFARPETSELTVTIPDEGATDIRIDLN